MIIFNLEDFNENCNFKNDIMMKSDLQTVYNDPIYPRDSKI